MKEPGLFGIHQSNRKGDDLWGKNQFNSTFPASLACYMRSKGISAVYIYIDHDLNVKSKEISIDDVFNSTLKNEELFFAFESKFDPYQKYSHDDIKHIDLVIKAGQSWFRPLEVKLTVIPDSTTCDDEENSWGSEIVIRPATTSYCALGMAYSNEKNFKIIRKIFEPVCHGIQHWDSKIEIASIREKLIKSINSFHSDFYKKQKPFLLQPVWKTKGKSPVLDKNAFDIIVWSDYAICRPFIDRSESNEDGVSRYMRSTARMARILYELSSIGKTHIEKIYTEMTFGHQSDKEFALSGKVTRDYIKSTRRFNPILPPDILKEIILNGGEKKLSPERRFDQTIYFTAEHLFG